jgi:hypothetical protein
MLYNPDGLGLGDGGRRVFEQKLLPVPIKWNPEALSFEKMRKEGVR